MTLMEAKAILYTRGYLVSISATAMGGKKVYQGEARLRGKPRGKVVKGKENRNEVILSLAKEVLDE